jgi:hypothetical protein
MVGQLGDDHSAVGVPDQHDRLIKAVEHCADVVGIRGQIA